MGRVSKDTLEKLDAFIASLPEEARSKCALCNETLTHIVKQAEAQTGAPMATVTRELAKRHNETAAPHDVVSAEGLKKRVGRTSGQFNSPKRTDYQQEDEPMQSEEWLEFQRKRHSQANYFMMIAITNMERIMDDDPGLRDAVIEVLEWCHKKLEEIDGVTQ